MAMYNSPHPGEFIQSVYLEPNGLSLENLHPNSALLLNSQSHSEGIQSSYPEMALRFQKLWADHPKAGSLCKTTMTCGKQSRLWDLENVLKSNQGSEQRGKAQ